MDQRRSYLKDLATKLADSWASSATPLALSGQARVDTRNTSYLLEDGVCCSVTRNERTWRADSSADLTQMIGMRLVGWLLHDDPYAGLQPEWRPGAYAVLWRARRAGADHSSVALTSATTAMTSTRRVSKPPPLPARARERPASPVSIVTPKMPSLTRMHVPPPPPTPTPTTQIRQMHRISPPPLPRRANRISP